MKTYSIVIRPESPFGTPLKGDTLFGHLCWQIVHDPALMKGSFQEQVRRYPEEPFAVISSAFPWLGEGKFALKRPDAPLDTVADLSGLAAKDLIQQRKDLKKRVWVVCECDGALQDFRSCRLMNDSELCELTGLDAKCFVKSCEVSHNSINRLTGTTGEGFAPFSQEVAVHAPGGRLVIFAGIDETVMNATALKTAFERIGICGFGRDASTGQGKFSVEDLREIDLGRYAAKSPNCLYTLSPSVPVADRYRDALFAPFTRFGRHGDRLAVSGKPYKNPVIMADEGALLFPRDMDEALKKPWVGKAITGLSKILPETVAQGYSLHIPARLEVQP